MTPGRSNRAEIYSPPTSRSEFRYGSSSEDPDALHLGRHLRHLAFTCPQKLTWEASRALPSSGQRVVPLEDRLPMSTTYSHRLGTSVSRKPKSRSSPLLPCEPPHPGPC